MKKLASLLAILPLSAIFFWSGANLLNVIVQEVMATWFDLTNWSLFNFFNPTTSPGGTASIFDIFIGGPGAVGGTGKRFYLGGFYFIISGIAFTTIRSLWGIVRFKEL